MIKYLEFSLSIAFISWIAGMLVTALLSKTALYHSRLSNLNFIANEKINILIGLKPFRWIIMHSFFKYFNPKLSMRKHIAVSELGEYRSEMTKAELNHLFAFLFMAVFVLIKLADGLYMFALVMLLINIVMNLYPSLLQQQNKRRIDRYLSVLNRRTRNLFAVSDVKARQKRNLQSI
jgi:hypothetical protein